MIDCYKIETNGEEGKSFGSPFFGIRKVNIVLNKGNCQKQKDGNIHFRSTFWKHLRNLQTQSGLTEHIAVSESFDLIPGSEKRKVLLMYI